MKCRIEHHHREVHALRNVPFKLLSGNAKLKWFEKGKFLWSHWRMGTFGLAAVTLLPEKKENKMPEWVSVEIGIKHIPTAEKTKIFLIHISHVY